MLPEILTLKGFLSYRKKQVLDFRKFHIALISGENGQGKSSLLDALTFALFSKARGVEGNRSGIEDLVTNGETFMEVSLQFIQGGTRYRIVRSFDKNRRHSDVRLEMQNGEGFISISEGSIRETDAKIQSILGMDYDAFVTSSFIMQGKADFFTTKKKDEKIEILRQILGLELYEKAKQVALDRINRISGEITGMENEILRLEEETKDIRTVEEALTSALRNHKVLQERKTATEEELKRIRKRYAKAKVLEEKIKNSAARINELNSKLENIETYIDGLKNELNKITGIINEEEEIEKGYEEFIDNQKLLN